VVGFAAMGIREELRHWDRAAIGLLLGLVVLPNLAVYIYKPHYEGATLCTAVVLYGLLINLRSQWHVPRFWIALVVWLSIHLIVISLLIRKVIDFGVSGMILVALGETLVVVFAVGLWLKGEKFLDEME
jgi:hypothetical protein